MNKFNAQPWAIGGFFFLAGIATAVVQAVLIGKLVPRYGEKRMAVFSLFGNAVGSLMIVSAPAFWVLFPIGFVHSAVVGFIWSTLGTLTANCVNEREQGQMAGVNSALAGLMSVLGPLAAGAVYDHVAPGAPYWLGAAVSLFAILLLVSVRVPLRETSRAMQPAD